jgi:molybdopterin-containing oxidoreductase family membrane subunit
MVEIRTAVMVFSSGFLLFTFLSKIAIAIVFEDYCIDDLSPKKGEARVGKVQVAR